LGDPTANSDEERGRGLFSLLIQKKRRTTLCKEKQTTEVVMSARSPPPRSPNLNGLRTSNALPNYNSIASPLSLEIVPVADDASSSVASDLEDHTTSLWQTYIHLVKGYIGVGCLSLPWALSQLGIPLGCLSLAVMSYWSSYNCWTIVKLKRFVEQKRPVIVGDGEPDAASDLQSNKSYTSSQLTYPEVGEWFFGRSFQSFVAASICTQQLAICTVFLSFIGENLLAVLQRLGWHSVNHATVMTLALPPVLVLSFLPNLKMLAPVMMVGTVLLLGTFCALATVIAMAWDERPNEVPGFSVASAPLALCAILYSYEGICLILPVESAMKEPQHFQAIFSAAMGTVAFILAAVASSCVLAFGQVTNVRVCHFHKANG
jgi:proton-coupled amino acid transporter